MLPIERGSHRWLTATSHCCSFDNIKLLAFALSASALICDVSMNGESVTAFSVVAVLGLQSLTGSINICGIITPWIMFY